MPHLEFETVVLQNKPKLRLIAGLDEAGRGALAGPVVAAAVILPLHDANRMAELEQVNDSKLLTAKKRDSFFDLITKHAVAIGVGSIEAQVIDEIGIVPATRLAMETAVQQLSPHPDFLLIDGRIKLPNLPHPQQSIIRGDSQSLTIAAASIIAKVTRDRHMVSLHAKHPPYHFAQHKGYGTQFHRDAIHQHGPCICHRFTFAPIRKDDHSPR